MPSGRSFPALPAGFYRVGKTNDGVYAEKQPIVSDKLTVLAGSCNDRVLTGIRRFWQSKAVYARYGLSYKRGVLFYGPPGAGKSATVTLLSKELVGQFDGAVFVCGKVDWLVALLQKLRKIEPERPLIVVMEDLDEIISNNGEHGLLALLDGETQIDNVVFLATTNYPERLGARIVNRPSRFDERIKVDMPSEETRRAYLELVTASDPLSPTDLRAWTAATEGMSISHLRELVVAVRCLGNDYGEVIERLKSMAIRPTAPEGLGKRIGLAS